MKSLNNVFSKYEEVVFSLHDITMMKRKHNHIKKLKQSVEFYQYLVLSFKHWKWWISILIVFQLSIALHNTTLLIDGVEIYCAVYKFWEIPRFMRRDYYKCIYIIQGDKKFCFNHFNSTTFLTWESSFQLSFSVYN